MVSAIGHEPDSPILDLVADVRASTPTDAAKRVVPDVAEEAHRVLQAQGARPPGRPRVGRPRAAPARGARCPARPWPTRAPASTSAWAEVESLRDRARRTFRHRLDRGEDDLVHQVARIRALSPLATLRRGYAVLSDGAGQALSSVATLEPGQDIHIRVADGRIGATTTTVDRIDLMPDTDETDDTDRDHEGRR